MIEAVTRPIRYRQLRQMWNSRGAVLVYPGFNSASAGAVALGFAAMLAATLFAANLVAHAGHHATRHQAEVILAQMAALILIGVILFGYATAAMSRLSSCPVVYRKEHVSPALISSGDWLEVSSLDWPWDDPAPDSSRRLVRVVHIEAAMPTRFALSDGSVLPIKETRQLLRVTDIEPTDSWAMSTRCAYNGKASTLDDVR